jgi:hypothetical protein
VLLSARRRLVRGGTSRLHPQHRLPGPAPRGDRGVRCHGANGCQFVTGPAWERVTKSDDARAVDIVKSMSWQEAGGRNTGT